MNRWMLILSLLLTSAATAQDTQRDTQRDICAPASWTGAWYVKGEARARALWLEQGWLNLEVPQGRRATQRLRARPQLDAEGRLTFRQRETRITLAALDADRLQVTRTEGRRTTHQVWHRSRAPRLSCATRRLRRRPGQGLRFDVTLTGRSQAVVIEIRPVGDPAPRYAKLRGLVHHEARTLPIGRSTIVWSGTDRSWRERPLLPGRYTVIVRPASAPLPGPRPPAARVELTLTIEPAPPAPAPAPAPATAVALKRPATKARERISRNTGRH